MGDSGTFIPVMGRAATTPLYRWETQDSSKLPKATQTLDDSAWSENTLKFCGMAQGIMVAARAASHLSPFSPSLPFPFLLPEESVPAHLHPLAHILPLGADIPLQRFGEAEQ